MGNGYRMDNPQQHEHGQPAQQPEERSIDVDVYRTDIRFRMEPRDGHLRLNHLIQKVLGLNMYLIDVPGDGRCFLHAFTLLFCIRDSIREILEKVLQYAQDNSTISDLFANKLAHRDYFDDLMLKGQWVSDDILPRILCEVYSKAFTIISSEDTIPDKTYIPTGVAIPDGKTQTLPRLGHIFESHFVTVFPNPATPPSCGPEGNIYMFTCMCYIYSCVLYVDVMCDHDDFVFDDFL